MYRLLGLFIFFVSYAYAGCTLTSKVCVDKGGYKTIGNQRVYAPCWKYAEKYTCSNNLLGDNDGQIKKVCTAYDTQKVCNKPDYIHGQNDYSKNATPPNNFNQAGKAISITNGVSQNPSDDINGSAIDVRLYGGYASRCVRPIWIYRTPVSPDCCDINVGNNDHWYQIFNRCDSQEKAIGLAKRNNADKYVGEYCNHWYRLGIWKLYCISYSRQNCRFDNNTTLMIQEKGRDQINQLIWDREHNNDKVAEYQNKFADDIAHWNDMSVNGVSIKSYTYAKPSDQRAEVAVNYPTDIIVNNGGSSTVNNTTINMVCKNDICSGEMMANGQVLNYQFSPDCQKMPKQKWTVGNAVIEQAACVSQDSIPADWYQKPYYDSEGNPSLFYFTARTFAGYSLGNPSVDWLLGKDEILGNGSCDTTGCNYNLQLNQNNEIQSAKLSFPYTCDNDRSKVTIGDVTIYPICSPNKVYIATCTQGQSCGALPKESDFEKDAGTTVNGWLFEGFSQAEATHVINKSVTIKGGCLNDDCNWEVSSLGASGSLEDIITTPINFAYLSPEADSNGNIKEGFTANN